MIIVIVTVITNCVLTELLISTSRKQASTQSERVSACKAKLETHKCQATLFRDASTYTSNDALIRMTVFLVDNSVQ